MTDEAINRFAAQHDLGFASKVFELIERWTADQRARVFFELERFWCWDCGERYEDCRCAGEPDDGEDG